MSVDLLATNDAMVWAEEFVKTMKKNKWTIDDIDEGLMVGWFANAMVAQELVMMRKIEKMVENHEIVPKFTSLNPDLEGSN